MEMTIDEIELALNSIKIVLEHTEKGHYPEQFKTHEECLKEVMDIARKYQKIEKILNSASYVENGTVYSYAYDEDSRIKHIREVIKDGEIVPCVWIDKRRTEDVDKT